MVPHKIKLPYDPRIVLLGIYPVALKAGSRIDICILTFIEALFTIARRWKPCRYP